MGLLDQWAADTQRKADEWAALWQHRQRQRARTGQLTMMDRWAAHAQRKSDEHAARWAQRQHEKAVSGRMSFMDGWAVRAQRKSDETAAKWREIFPIIKLLNSGPVRAPSGSSARIYIEATGFCGATSLSGGAYGGAWLLLVPLLITWALNVLAFRGSWTVHVHTDTEFQNIHVRVPNQLAAYRAAAELVPRFEADGPAALESWRADVTARAQVLAVKPTVAPR